MTKSPCLDCVLKDEDKNNSACINCKKRTRYVYGLERQLEFTASYAGDHDHVLRITG